MIAGHNPVNVAQNILNQERVTELLHVDPGKKNEYRFMTFTQVGGHGSLSVAFNTVIFEGREYYRRGGPGVGGNCEYMSELKLIRLITEFKWASSLYGTFDSARRRISRRSLAPGKECTGCNTADLKKISLFHLNKSIL